MAKSIEYDVLDRAKRLLFSHGRLDFGTEDRLLCYLRLGDYHLHWDDQYGLTVNQKGNIHATIFRVGSRGSFEKVMHDYLPGLRSALMGATVLDDLAEIADR